MGSKLSTKNQKLEKAIQARKLKVVKKWIKKGADPNGYSKKSNYSFLSMAITLREEALVELLLKKGANPNQKSWLPIGKDTLDSRSNSDDEYPIHIAAAHGSIKIMQALLDSKIDINKGIDHKQGTALHQAARFGHSKLAELLLSNGADIIGIDSRLNIPLHIAATFGQVKVAEVLLRFGSPVDTLNIRKWTSLHYAASEGALSMTRLLLQHGAATTAEDTAGRIPLRLAKTEEIIRLFLEHAADLEEVNSHSINVEGPPKPTRTFAYLTKSYAEFGKWTRLHKHDSGKEKAPNTFEHRRIRKTKSAPHKKCRRGRNDAPEQSKNVAQTCRVRNRSSSLYQVQDKKISVTKRSCSVRHHRVKQEAKLKPPPSTKDYTKPMRSKSTSALRSRGQYPNQTRNQRPSSIKGVDLSHLPREDDRRHTEESINNVTPIPASLGCLSRSLHDVAEITTKTSESPACYTNNNIAQTKRIQRTKSEGRVQPKNCIKESWVDFQLAKTAVSR